MKKLLLSLITFLSFAIVGCVDTDVTNVPTIQVPNANYLLEYVVSFYQAYTTTPLPTRFTSTTNRTTNELVITDIINVDSKTEMIPSCRVVNGGKDIEITYKDNSPAGSVSVGTKKDVQMIHKFSIVQYGRGTGATINVRINYVYPNAALGANTTDFKTITP